MQHATSITNLKTNITCALDRIPPLWPLRHFVAVNPYLGFSAKPFAEATGLLQKTMGQAPFLSEKEYLQAWQSGEISKENLAEAARGSFSQEDLLAALNHLSSPKVIPTVADMLDHEKPRAHWSRFVIEEISRWCAISFDENQTTWASPFHSDSLYQSWLQAAAISLNPEAFGIAGFRKTITRLPLSAEDCIQHCLQTLLTPEVDPVDFMHRQLCTISGWAGYLQYLVREDTMRGNENNALIELLAIRLSFDFALFQAHRQDAAFLKKWETQPAVVPDAQHLEKLACWQTAYELQWQNDLAIKLASQPKASSADAKTPIAQAAFCIDVRSELYRRHLEAAMHVMQTIGFAGFFGFPVAHRPAGADHPTTRCPVLLVPPVVTCETNSEHQEEEAKTRQSTAGAWKAFQNSATSCFSFVESTGLAFGYLLATNQAKSRSINSSRPHLNGSSGETLASRAAMATGALRNMSLTKNFARLVLFCGHGASSANNPHASSLDCGACGGHAGDVNARLAVDALNDREVRSILAGNGIRIPDTTYFLAGLHNTTIDEVTLLDEDDVPSTHLDILQTLKVALTKAGKTCRQERAPSLGLAKTPVDRLLSTLQLRSADISQVRPEWALANNSTIIVSPRSRSQALNLGGRAFLHDYDAAADTDASVLTLILCAPVVVASWINLQYYASRVDHAHYGAGNKAIHHVAGGLGVYEGNGGDLKTGLPWQSIHDGEKFIHEPRRLSVIVDAPRQRIFDILQAQPAVKQLFDNQCIHLFALESKDAWSYKNNGWKETY